MTTQTDNGVSDSLRLLLRLVRLQESCPPASAVSAISRATSQILILSAIYDMSIEKDGDGCISLADWCSTFVRAIERGFGGAMNISYSARSEARLPLPKAQTLGLALGELLADSHDRASSIGFAPIAELALDEDVGGGVRLKIRDGSPSKGLPTLATMLALALGGSLSETKAEGYCERVIAFDVAASSSMQESCGCGPQP
jgi:hypothetical protein